jgi:pancreatic triacylglycerol lipase
LPRNVINTRFILYTEENSSDGQLLVAEDKDTIVNSHFRPDRLTKFIIHGFIDTPLSSWVSEMKTELLKYSSQNQGRKERKRERDIDTHSKERKI